MIDYLAVLNRTLAGFPNPQEDLRTKLYERARITIQRQLESREPNINENQINLEMRKLEEAILTIEQGYANGVGDGVEDTRVGDTSAEDNIEEGVEDSVGDSVEDTAQQEEEQETQQTLPEMVSEPVSGTVSEPPVPETPTGVEDSAQHTLNIEDTSVGDTAQQEEEEQKQEIEQQTIAERDPIDDILKKLDEPNLTLQEDNRRTSDTSGNDTQSMAQVPQTQGANADTADTSAAPQKHRKHRRHRGLMRFLSNP